MLRERRGGNLPGPGEEERDLLTEEWSGDPGKQMIDQCKCYFLTKYFLKHVERSVLD